MLHKRLAPYADATYTVLRVMAGLMFAFHGMQKIFGVLSPFKAHFPTQMWFGGVIELTAGLAIAVGFYASCAAFIASGTMAVAYVQFHWKLRFGKELFPGVNEGELALLYSFLFLLIA